MTLRKATHRQTRRENRQLLLRLIYNHVASSRVDLANETGLAKPTVSDLIGELIEEGYLVEKGFGQSTDEGGKRPRLLSFVPGAREVIGISITDERVLGVLSDLNGVTLVHHVCNLASAQGTEVIDRLHDVINGLRAQQSAPLLCIGVGVPREVDRYSGVVQGEPYTGSENRSLAERLRDDYEVPVHVANSTEMAALAQYAFGQVNGADNLVTVLVNEDIGIGMVLDGAAYHSGGEIGLLKDPTLAIGSDSDGAGELEKRLGWHHVRQMAQPLAEAYVNKSLVGDKLTYLHIREALSDQEPLALALQDDLATALAHIFAWAAAILRPNHISLVGGIADLGEAFLVKVVQKTQVLLWSDAFSSISFSLDNASNLVAVGAVAYTLHKELGLL